MPVAMCLVSRIPPGPHYMPVSPDYAFTLVNDGKVVARTRYSINKSHARRAAFALAKRKGFTVINADVA